MGINKVEYNNVDGTETLIDLTADTVTPETLVKGATAHDKSGANITGTADYAIPSTSTTSPLSDSADGMVQGLTIYGRSKKSKNLLEITATTRTDSGITFTVKSNGTIIANGTATASAYLSLGTDTREYCVEGQSYVLSGSPGNGVVLYTGNWSDGWNDTGNGSTIIYSNSISNKIYIVINANSTVNNVVIKPMICTAADYAADPTFEPYFEGIKSVGDDGLTVATANSDNTLTTSAEFTTALPLRGVSDTVRDKLICTADVKQVETVYGKVRLADLTWSDIPPNRFIAETISTQINAPATANDTANILCAKYQRVPLNYLTSNPTVDNLIAIGTTGIISIRDTDYTTVSDFVASLGDAELVYELATPVITPLTAAEISAFRGLRTFEGTTNITISDEPDFEIDYLKNSDNGKAVADIQKDLQGQINGITVELTQAEYDDLTEEEKNNGTIYFITNAPSGITIDSELSATSTNAVQNRVITSQVNKILSEAEIQAQINDRIYQGTDLTVKFADEISASPYNGDPWAWIKARIQANNFAGIHVCDYIPITANSVTINAQIAGINTYKNYGDSAVGSHIDFICKELWPTLRPVNPVNFNNGTAAENHPWLASDLYLYLNSLAGTAPSAAEVGGGTGTAVDYTADGVYYYLPTQLKDVIIEKRFLLPKRYSASKLLSDDNNWGWVNIGKLWLPDECEVYGMPVWGGKGSYSLGGSSLQYPLFAGNMNRVKFRNGGRDGWWLLSPYSGNSTYWCLVGSNGDCSGSNASGSWVAAPVCFRVG